MLTYTSGRTLFTNTLTNNTSSTNLTFADTFINQYTLETLHKFPLILSEQTFRFNGFQTLPNTQFVTLPVPMRKISTVIITVGNSTTYPGFGFNWPVRECPNLQFWNQLNLTNNIMSDIPQYFMVINGQLGLYPRPAVGYNPITIIGQQEPIALSVADTTNITVSMPYALTLTATVAIGDVAGTLSAPNTTLPTGTYQILFSSGEQRLCTLTSASTAVTWAKATTAVATIAVTIHTSTGGEIVTGNAGFTASMIGYTLQTTDKYWYFIDGFIDSTHVTISQPYQGSAVASAASIIGQASLIQQAYQMLPLYRSAELYYTVVSKDETRMNKYKSMADDLEATIRIVEGNKTTDPTIEDNLDKQLINPNLTVNITDSGIGQ